MDNFSSQLSFDSRYRWEFRVGKFIYSQRMLRSSQGDGNPNTASNSGEKLHTLVRQIGRTGSPSRPLLLVRQGVILGG